MSLVYNGATCPAGRCGYRHDVPDFMASHLTSGSSISRKLNDKNDLKIELVYMNVCIFSLFLSFFGGQGRVGLGHIPWCLVIIQKLFLVVLGELYEMP